MTGTTPGNTPSAPSAAGMYDFYLGGSSYSPADRAAAEQITKVLPEIRDGAWANRGFLQRAVRRMASQWGIQQFLDIGSGLPTQQNTHDVAAESNPRARVLYVDIDPAVVDRASTMLAGVAQTVGVIQGDVRDPDGILCHPETRRLIDFTQPVGLLLAAVLHFVSDDDDPWALVRRYRDVLAPGSYLAISHTSMGDQVSERTREVGTRIYAATPNPPTDRSRTEIARLLDGFEIVPPYEGAPPSVVFVGLWGAEDPALADSEGSRLGYAAVARRP